jgi:hypothetical protein
MMSGFFDESGKAERRVSNSFTRLSLSLMTGYFRERSSG